MKPTTLMKRGLLSKMFCPQGWIRVYIPRLNSPRMGDVYYFAPDGTRLRSSVEIERWHHEKKVPYNASLFSMRDNTHENHTFRPTRALSPSGSCDKVSAQKNATFSEESKKDFPVALRLYLDYIMPESSRILSMQDIPGYVILCKDISKGKRDFQSPSLDYRDESDQSQMMELIEGFNYITQYSGLVELH